MEHLSLDPAQRKDRQVHRRNDADAEHAGPNHFGSRACGSRKAFLARHDPAQRTLLVAESAQAVLDDDDRTIHDQTEIQRAQAHQVA